MPTHRSGPQRVQQGEAQPEASSVPYDVEFSDQAFAVYEHLYQKMLDAEKRGETCSANHTVFRMIEDAIKNFIPLHPIDRDHGLTGPLSKFFRIKKGRYRICWAASSEKRKVCILFISETMRKAGDSNDPYNIFQKLVESGKFDHLLGKLGIELKTLKAGPPAVLFN